jgi:hypothetical protein
MNKRAQAGAAASLAAIGVLTLSHGARAGGPYDCSGAGTCVNAVDTSNNDIAIYAQASGTGTVGGVFGTSGYQGVTGVASTTGQGCDPSAGYAAGVCGFAGDPGGYGGYFEAAGAADTGTVAALYGNGTGTGGTGVLVHRRPSGINACARPFGGAWLVSSRSG